VLEGIRRTVLQLERGEARLENAYARAVQPEGNLPAQQMLADVFAVTDRGWRGIGVIPQSGWRLRDRYRDFDAEVRFAVQDIHTQESAFCHSGEVLRGLLKPNQCPAFGKECTPRTPSAPRWCRARARARRIISMGGLFKSRSYSDESRV
jgi:hydrogenase expression/formation protein HypD